MGLGLLFQQILLSIFYSMVQLDYKLHLEWNRNCILMTAACYLCCYLLALFRSQKKFRKMNIHDLMDSQRQNEEIKMCIRDRRKTVSRPQGQHQH